MCVLRFSRREYFFVQPVYCNVYSHPRGRKKKTEKETHSAHVGLLARVATDVHDEHVLCPEGVRAVAALPAAEELLGGLDVLVEEVLYQSSLSAAMYAVSF